MSAETKQLVMTLTPQIPKVPTKFGILVHTFEAKSVGPVKQDTL